MNIQQEWTEVRSFPQTFGSVFNANTETAKYAIIGLLVNPKIGRLFPMLIAYHYSL